MKSRLTGSWAMNLLIMAVIVTLPLMYSGLFTWAYQKPMDNLGKIDAVVVNQDHPATATLPDGKKLELNLGKELGDELYKQDAPGFRWVPAKDAADARAGLESGKYQVALWIPENLSADLARLAEFKDTRRATLRLETNDGTNYLTGTMAHSVALTLQNLASEKGSARFDDKLLLSLGSIHDGLTAAGEGAGTLASGEDRLVSGTERVRDGAHQLTASIGEFAAGSQRLDAALREYTGGVASLEAGAVQVNNGMHQFGQEFQKLDSGLGTLNAKLAETGEDSFAGGLNRLLAATAVSGDTLSGGSQPTEASPTLADGAQKIVDGAAGVQAGADKLAAGTAQLNGGIAQLHTAAGQASQQLPQMAAGTAQLVALVDGLRDACGGIAAADMVCQGLRAQGVDFATLSPQVHALQTGIQGPLTAFVNGVSAATGPGSDPAHPTLADAAARVSGGASQLASGAAQLSVGAQAEKEGISKLHDGLSGLHSGYKQLSQGVASAATGAESLGTAVQKLSSGTDQVASGAQQLREASPQLESGAEKLSAGAGELSAGSGRLEAGADKVYGGATSAAAGARELQDKLQGASASVPNVSREHGQKLADVAAGPIQVDAVRANAVAENGVGFAPFFMSLAMWVGAIAMYLVFPALDRRRHADEHFLVSPLRSLRLTLPFAMIQAILVVAGLELLLDLGAKELWQLFVVCLVTAFCFLVLNQGFIALMGYRGRFASILMLLLQITSAGATFPIQTAPRFFQVLNPLLPMTYSAQAIREHIAGNNLALFPGFGIVAVWILIGVGMVVLGAWLHPGTRPMKHDPAFAFPGRAHQPAVA